MRTFELENPATGERRDVLCEPRDLRKVMRPGERVASVPSRIAVCPRGETPQGEEVIRGFYKLEQQMGGASRVVDATGLRSLGVRNADAIKKVWSRP